MGVPGVVYLDGAYVPKGEARVSVDDRGFLLGDGIYEVTPAYRGSFFRAERHVARMRRGLAALRIDFDPAELADVHHRLLELNGLLGEEVATVYVQVTRGAAPRTHAFPASPVPPTVYAFAAPYRRPPRERWERGFHAITVPDVRWSRVDLKTISLLANALAQQSAVEAGVDDAIQVRDGVALEGCHNNLFAVLGGVVTTHPLTNHVLPGVTRECVLELAREVSLPVEERPIRLDELGGADEVFLTGTTTEVRPTVTIDGRPVGTGRVGPVAKALFEAFLARVTHAGPGDADTPPSASDARAMP